MGNESREYIKDYLNKTYTEEDTMYKGMELNKRYTLKDLGLE